MPPMTNGAFPVPQANQYTAKRPCASATPSGDGARQRTDTPAIEDVTPLGDTDMVLCGDTSSLTET